MALPGLGRRSSARIGLSRGSGGPSLLGSRRDRRLIDCAQPGSALAGLRRSRVLGRFSHLARGRATSRSRRGFARPSRRPCGAGSRRSRRRGSEVCLVLEGSAAFQELLFDAPRSAASPAICARGCSDRRGLAGCGVAGLWGSGARCPEAAPPRDRHPGASGRMVEGRADSLAVVGSAARPDAATLWRLYVDEGLAIDSLVHRFSGPGALFRRNLPFVEP